MTIAQLIGRLKRLPPDAQAYYYDSYYGFYLPIDQLDMLRVVPPVVRKKNVEVNPDGAMVAIDSPHANSNERSIAALVLLTKEERCVEST